MPGCVLKSCTNHSKSKNKEIGGITFHRFAPTSNGLREKWIKFVQKNRNEDTWLPSSHAYICSDHFKDEDKYITKGGRLYLKKTAVPFDKNVPTPAPESEPETFEYYVSDSESIFDSPSEITLKLKLNKVTTEKQELAVKLKKIQRQNWYLKRRCEAYRLIVKDLKERFTSAVAGTPLEPKDRFTSAVADKPLGPAEDECQARPEGQP